MHSPVRVADRARLKQCGSAIKEREQMSTKIKALCAGVLALAALGSVAAINAGATVGGHFLFGSHHVTIVGEEGGTLNHRIHFRAHGASDNERIGCEIAQYHGTHVNSAETTTTEVTVTPTWEKCYTTGTPNTKFDVHENGCHIIFTVRTEPEVKHNTVHFTCPAGKAVVITHPNCVITVPSQTPTGGVIYKTIFEENTHSITLESTATIKTEYHGGICVFLGTNHEATMEGSATVTGKNPVNQAPINITAT